MKLNDDVWMSNINVHMLHWNNNWMNKRWDIEDLNEELEQQQESRTCTICTFRPIYSHISMWARYMYSM